MVWLGPDEKNDYWMVPVAATAFFGSDIFSFGVDRAMGFTISMEGNGAALGYASGLASQRDFLRLPTHPRFGMDCLCIAYPSTDLTKRWSEPLTGEKTYI